MKELTMQAYTIDDPYTRAIHDQAAADYAADQARFPRDPRTPCDNPDCPALCESLYCSEPCRVIVEGTEPDEQDVDPNEYYEAYDVTLGHIATADAQWAQDQAAGGLAALVCGYAAPAAPATPAPLPEAPVSMNVHVEMAGRDVLVTLRGVDEHEVLARLETLLARVPVTLAFNATPSSPSNGTIPTCPIHQVPMKEQHGKDGSTWRSHKTTDGWCHGKS
jgi:hypothetical protein